MASSHRRKTLGDYFTLQRGTTYKSRLLDQPGPVLLGLASIQRNGGFRTDSLRTYGGESPEKLLVRPGEIYVSLKDVTQSADLLGAAARLPRDHAPGRLTQDTVKLEPRGPGVPADYLYWLMHTPQYRSYCRAHATGTTNLGLAREDFLAFPAPEPTQSQLLMVGLLNELDERIELNHRISETTEAMARALFTSWFVEFEPVRAKGGGSCSRLPQPLSDLFSSRLVDSEVGEIPVGWEVKPFAQVIEMNPARPLRKGTLAPYLSMGNMPTRSHSPDAVGMRVFESGTKFINGDTLVARITPSLENGKTAYVDFLEADQVGWGSTEYIVLRPRPPLPPEFAYCLARSDQFRDFAIQNMIGSSGRQRVPTDSLSYFKVVVPSEPVAESFGSIVQPLFARASHATRQSKAIAKLRNELLTKLISGELDAHPIMRDAEAVH